MSSSTMFESTPMNTSPAIAVNFSTANMTSESDQTPMDRIGSVAETQAAAAAASASSSDPLSGGNTNPATIPLLKFLLTGQHESWFGRLYESEAVCLGLFRLLPPLCRQIIMSALWTTGHVRAKEIKVLLRMNPNANHADLEAKLQLLFSLSILNKSTHKGIMMIHLHGGFKTGLRNALTGAGSSSSFGVSYQTSEGDGSIDVSIDELIEYGDTTWESMLKFMVSSRSLEEKESVKPSSSVLNLLVESGLMRRAADEDFDDLYYLQITSQGFQFLLEERSVQIWQILMYYLQAMAKNTSTEGDGVDVLQLYFTLSNMQLGRAYSASKLSATQSKILNNLEDYGLIYKRPKSESGVKHDQFYPTRLATTLCSGSGPVSSLHSGGDPSTDSNRGFLILETNYKIYAYTANELEIAILNLFVDIRVRYPNLIVGRLERDTVKRAMSEGISAQQIISYLTTHAHPQMHKNNPLLPITVVDQLHLWDKERNRLQTAQGALLEFRQKHLFEDGLAYAKTLNCLLYETSKFVPGAGFRGRIFVSAFAQQPIRDYLRTRREQHEKDEEMY